MSRARFLGLLCCACLLGGAASTSAATAPRPFGDAPVLASVHPGSARLGQTLLLLGRGLPGHGWVRVHLRGSKRSLTIAVGDRSRDRLRVALRPSLSALLRRRHGRLEPTRVRLWLTTGRGGSAARSRAIAFVMAPAPPVTTHAAAARHTSADMGLFEDLQYMTGSALQTRLDQYQAIGAKWARFQMIWSNVQSGGPASYDWQPYDELIAGLVARGIQPLVVIDTTPNWARPGDCQAQPTCAPADPAQYAQFAAAAVARYHSEVRYWEIWNEPNNQVFWQPTPNVGAYTALLKLTYAAIKGVDPSAEVITGGTGPAETTLNAAGETLSISAVDFLAGIYRDGGGGSFDAVGDHPYTFPSMPGAPDAQSAWQQMYATPTSLRSLMVAHGDGAKRIWGTEFGAPTDPQGQGYVDEAEQAAMLTRAYELWSSYSWTGPLIWFSYQDSGTNLESREEFYGLTQAGGTPKPAYFAFKALAGAG
jgi:hypothetical protein